VSERHCATYTVCINTPARQGSARCARLTWTPVDDSTARATLRDRGAAAVADFHFGSRGEVVRVTGSRYRAVGAGQVLTPTEGWHRAYARVGGMMIPTDGEVAWLLPEGSHAYWRARVVRATYEYDGD
jgi:hypothetical protein